MSREFGSFSSGYFHTQIELAAEDCLSGGHEITKLWGGVLQKMSKIAYAISSAEACDSGIDHPILQTTKDISDIKAELAKIEAYIRPFREVADKAAREAASKYQST